MGLVDEGHTIVDARRGAGICWFVPYIRHLGGGGSAVETVFRPPGNHQTWMDFFAYYRVPPKPTTDGTVGVFYTEKIARLAWMPASLRDLSSVVRWTDECPIKPRGIGSTHTAWAEGTYPRRAPEGFPEPRELGWPTGVRYRSS